MKTTLESLKSAQTAKSLQKQGAPAPDEIGKVRVEFSQDSGEISSYSAQIKTLDELLAATKVDTTVWEVDKFVANKWEIVMREPATTVGGSGKDALIAENDDGGGQRTLWTRDSNKPLHEPLWQIKVWLKRKQPQQVAVQSLLEQITNSRLKLYKGLAAPKHLRGKRSRALEVCVMDPHIGLLCQYPEADAPWDLDLAARTIMSAIEDLIDKTKKDGPFSQVFMPFGNDFVHSDTVFHETTAGTGQPESISWHRVYEIATKIAISMVERLKTEAPEIYIYEVPGNHSRMADYTLAKYLEAHYRHDKNVHVDASSSPYKFHRYGCNLIGYEHGHSVKPIRLAALMANERRQDWAETEYREFHLGDQHRKGSSKPSMLEEQGVSIEYIPGLAAPNEWHRLKSFSHQQRGAMAFVWDAKTGPVGRYQFNISKYTHRPLK